MKEKDSFCRIKQFVIEKGLSCIFYDFDGVMTDNRVLVDENGIESVFVNRGDGHGVACIRKFGIPQVIVSTEKNKVVNQRAKKLNIPVMQGVSDKKSCILEYVKDNKIDLTRSIFIGNDTNDIPAFEIVGIKVAPSDAEVEILNMADMISEKKGGEGVVRDLYRWIEKELMWNAREVR